MPAIFERPTPDSWEEHLLAEEAVEALESIISMANNAAEERQTQPQPPEQQWDEEDEQDGTPDSWDEQLLEEMGDEVLEALESISTAEEQQPPPQQTQPQEEWQPWEEQEEAQQLVLVVEVWAHTTAPAPAAALPRAKRRAADDRLALEEERLRRVKGANKRQRRLSFQLVHDEVRDWGWEAAEEEGARVQASEEEEMDAFFEEMLRREGEEERWRRWVAGGVAADEGA